MVISTRGVQILGQKRCQRVISQKKIAKSQHYGFFHFFRFVWIKKNERSLEKMVNFAQNTNFDIFPQKLNMKAYFPNFFGFFTCLVRFLQYLKTGNIEGNFVFVIVKSSSYEQSLKKRWKLAQTQILIFSNKNKIWKHIFSIFHIFTYSGCFSKHTLYVHWNHCFFFNPHKSSKIGKSAMLWFG